MTWGLRTLGAGSCPAVTQRKGGVGSGEALAEQEPHLHAGLRLEGDSPGRVLGGDSCSP